MQTVTETGAAGLHSLQGARNRSLDVELVELDERAFRLLCGGGRHAGGHGALAGPVEVGSGVAGRVGVDERGYSNSTIRPGFTPTFSANSLVSISM